MFCSSRNCNSTMAKFFNGKVVIVTGSSSGIGAEAALRFAAAGAKVTITGRKAEGLEATKRLCVQAGAKEGDILEVLGDIAEEATAAKIVRETVARFGGIDVLVNNAGAFCQDEQGRAGIAQPLSVFDRTLNVNLRSVLVISQLAVPYLEKTKGAIINISSIAAFHYSNPGAPYYCVAKAALDQLTVQMAGTLIAQGIRVNSINPGIIETQFLQNAGLSDAATKQVQDAWAANRQTIPAGRLGQPHEIVEMILYLADSSRSDFTVGAKITIDGGSVFQNTLTAGERHF